MAAPPVAAAAAARNASRVKHGGPRGPLGPRTIVVVAAILAVVAIAVYVATHRSAAARAEPARDAAPSVVGQQPTPGSLVARTPPRKFRAR